MPFKMRSNEDLAVEAAGLVDRLAERCACEKPLGSMSVSIYDTAWVSMVQKQAESVHCWLFPQSFQYLLDNQSSSGSWENGGSDSDGTDGILNTMAGLLSLLTHLDDNERTNSFHTAAYLEARIRSSIGWLNEKLQGWSVSRADQVAFEVLVPSHLDLLRAKGVEFHFPGFEKLARLNADKMAKFEPEFLYGSDETTAIHSLEAFVGKIDFDRIRHRLSNGSMMCSPSSTAAYLINTSTWDDEAESYLCMVLEHGQGAGNGAVPAAFPSDVFEISWVLSTLLEAKYTVFELGSVQANRLADHLEAALARGGDTTGFSTASGVMPDADDTSKAILSLHLMGRPKFKPDRLIKVFDNDTLFRTYHAERNPSFSANCNILNALLHLPDKCNYAASIHKVVEYLCRAWLTGSARDKWYSHMLLAQAFSMTLVRWDSQELESLSEDLIQNHISLVLTQILSRTMLSQEANGSWYSGSCEVTAYGILTLKGLTAVPFLSSMSSDILKAIAIAQQYLAAKHDHWTDLTHIWIEKTAYGSSVLAQAYCLAAMQSKPLTRPRWRRIRTLVDPPVEKCTKFIQFFGRLPLYSHLGQEDLMLKLSVLERYLLLPRLKAVRLEIFPRKDMAEDKWLEYIPLTWTCCNYLGPPVETELLVEMMLLSMLNYQVDEYMEAVVGTYFADRPGTITAMIRRLCCPNPARITVPQKRPKPDSGFSVTNGIKDTISEDEDAATKGKVNVDADGAELAGVEEVLGKYIAHILTHPSALHAPASTRARLQRELATFLCAHVTQNSDNAALASQSPTGHDGSAPFTSASSTFYQWVRTTSAEHTSAPFSFIFFECLITGAGAGAGAGAAPGEREEGGGGEVFAGARAEYTAEDLARHLGSMCRMYNDYGSAARDRAARNLNCLDFPEFRPHHGGSGGGVGGGVGGGRGDDCRGGDGDGGGGVAVAVGEAGDDARRKADLMYLAEYERKGVEQALEALGGGLLPAAEVGEDAMARLRLFANVTDLYGQIYVARDIASRLKGEGDDW